MFSQNYSKSNFKNPQVKKQLTQYIQASDQKITITTTLNGKLMVGSTNVHRKFIKEMTDNNRGIKDWPHMTRT